VHDGFVGKLALGYEPVIEQSQYLRQVLTLDFLQVIHCQRFVGSSQGAAREKAKALWL